MSLSGEQLVDADLQAIQHYLSLARDAATRALTRQQNDSATVARCHTRAAMRRIDSAMMHGRKARDAMPYMPNRQTGTVK